jgi:hypothetical protein
LSSDAAATNTGRIRRRWAAALVAAGLALVLAASPVTATEIYRSTAWLYNQTQSTWYGTATLDRWFSSSPPAPLKTHLKLEMTGLNGSRWHWARVIAGDCWGEGVRLASFRVQSGTSGKIKKTLALTATQRRAVQKAFDRGWPLIVTFVGGGRDLCGDLE